MLVTLTFTPDIFAQDFTQWHLPEGAKARLGKGNINEIKYSPDGTKLAVASSIGVWIYDAQTGEELNLFTGHMYWVRSVSFSPDGSTLASGSGDRTIRLWNATDGTHIRTLRGHRYSVLSVSFSPDGSTLASGSSDRTIRLWNATDGTHIRTLQGHTVSVNSVSFSPDGTTLASGSSDKTIRLWNMETGTQQNMFTEHTGGVHSIAFSPDGNTLASGSSGGTVRLWDVKIGTEKNVLTGHTGGVHSIAFSPDGTTLATGSGDGTILLWDLAPTSDAVVSLSPASVVSPNVGEQLTFSLNIAEGENIAGYQATVQFDTFALRYVESSNADYLPAGAFFLQPVAEGNTVTLAATSLSGEVEGDGTLATITFEVVTVKASSVRLSNVILTDSSGSSSTPQTENAAITEPPQLPEDVNKDGIVNIIDLTLVASNFGKTGENIADINGDGIVNIVDLTLVAAAFGNTAAAPIARGLDSEIARTRTDVEAWLREARQLNLADPAFQRGIQVLEQLLASLTPKETTLLPNYPNPLNPEIWIPYQLAPTDSSLVIG